MNSHVVSACYNYARTLRPIKDFGLGVTFCGVVLPSNWRIGGEDE